MAGRDILDILFVTMALFFQLVLVIHFALRKWNFDLSFRYGPIVYLFSIPAVALSIVLLLNGKTWSLWLGGFLYLGWAIFGYTSEYILKIQWRSPIYWPVFGPYITLYLATVMFYWWPLALVYKPLWYAYLILFVTSTFLNVTSHQRKQQKLT